MKALEKASVEGDLQDFIKIVARAVGRSLDTYLYVVGWFENGNRKVNILVVS